MMQTELTVKVAGTEYPVYIRDTDGVFFATVGPSEQITADSYAELEKKARRIKVKFELPFTQITDSGVRHGTVTGLHATSGNLLVRWDNGQTEQISGWSGQGANTMPRLTDEEATTAVELVRARNASVKALAAFTDARKFVSLKRAAETERDKADAARLGT